MKTSFTTLLCLLLTTTFLQANGDPDYCSAYGKSEYYGWIAGVRMCNVNNHSGFSYNGYGDYMHQTIEVEAGKKYPISLTPRTWPAFHEDARWTVWIDFDHDGKFEESEVVVKDSYSREITAWVVIPSDAKDGDTRMRVGMRFIYDPVPCGYYWYGEVEDYAVHVKNPYYGHGYDYCKGWGKNSKYGYIKQVKVCEINKVSGCDPSGYADYTKLMCKITQNKRHDMYLKPYLRKQYDWWGDWYMEKPHWMVWIDYNQDQKFDKEEMVCDSACYDPLQMHFDVPSWAKPGKTRMWVAMHFKDHDKYKPDPCDGFWYGEVEDYSVWVENGPPAPKYCESSGQDPNYGYIYQVWLGDLDNYSNYSHNGYGDYTHMSTVMYRNDHGTLFLKPSLNWVHDAHYGWIKPSAYWCVWIDFNHNGKFDYNEKVAFDHSSSWVWSYVYIPAWAKTGKTRMRVAMGFDDYPDPCGTYWYGEVEDYTIDIHDHYDPLVVNPPLDNPQIGTTVLNRDLLDIGIAPNPASSSIRLDLPGNGEGQLSIISLAGNVIVQQTRSAGSSQESIDQLQAGTYFVRWIDATGEVYTKRFIKN